MILLFGTRAMLRLMATVTFACPYCGVSSWHEVLQQRNRFTVFFLPLFTFSTSYFERCTNCGGETPLSEQQAQHSVQWAAGRLPA